MPKNKSNRSVSRRRLSLTRIRKYLFLPEFLRQMKKLEIGGLSDGNSVMLISDGDVCFGAFMKDIKKAKRSINLETYIFKSDHIGWMIAEALAERSKRGVEVNVIYDAFGSIGTSSAIFSFMKKNGIEVIEYNPLVPWRKFFNLTLRDHRKILVIDGSVAYVGGINIGSEYAGKKLRGGSWRDTHARIEGPAVKDIQFFFIENWFRQGGSIIENSRYFPDLHETGDMRLMVISTRSRKKIRPIFESYFSAIKASKKSIFITNAYFIPDRRIYHELVQAAERGVDVRIILPGISDIQIVKHASRYLYHYYIRHGIKVYEYQNTILHAKTAVIDGIWSTIGSSNLDRISLYTNLELNVAVLDNRFGFGMEMMFCNDIEKSTLISKENISRRKIGQFILQWLSYRFRNIL